MSAQANGVLLSDELLRLDWPEPTGVLQQPALEPCRPGCSQAVMLLLLEASLTQLRTCFFVFAFL